MRRSDREMRDMDQIRKVVLQQSVCCTAFHDDPCPYLIPLNYGAELEGDRLVLYFHGARDGKKMELLSKNPQVSFSILGDYSVQLNSEKLEHSTTKFESVCGFGRAQIVGDSEKKHGLTAIMNQIGRAGGKVFSESDFSDSTASRTCVWKITVDGLTGKRNQ